jgi:hypothetical protein
MPVYSLKRKKERETSKWKTWGDCRIVDKTNHCHQDVQMTRPSSLDKKKKKKKKKKERH